MNSGICPGIAAFVNGQDGYRDTGTRHGNQHCRWIDKTVACHTQAWCGRFFYLTGPACHLPQAEVEMNRRTLP